MPNEQRLYKQLSFDSFLEYTFLRWILSPAVQTEMISYVIPQAEIQCGEHKYRIVYAITGQQLRFAVEIGLEHKQLFDLILSHCFPQPFHHRLSILADFFFGLCPNRFQQPAELIWRHIQIAFPFF